MAGSKVLESELDNIIGDLIVHATGKILLHAASFDFNPAINTILTGAGVPAAGLGNDGDFYIRQNASRDLYGPKTAGAWGAPTSLVGPAGPQGPQGPAGTSGTVPKYSDAVAADAPTAYWHLDETSGTNAADVQGNDAGTYTGGFTLGGGGASGALGRSVALNGTTGRVALGSPANLPGTAADHTLECFMRRNGNPAGVEYLIGLVDGSVNGIALGLGTGGKLLLGVTGTTIADTGKLSVTDNLWHHVAAVYDNTAKTVTFFVDGVRNSVVSTGTAMTTYAGPFCIGSRGDGAANFFNGDIDEVAIYRGTKLTDIRIAAHMASKFVG